MGGQRTPEVSTHIGPPLPVEPGTTERRLSQLGKRVGISGTLRLPAFQDRSHRDVVARDGSFRRARGRGELVAGPSPLCPSVAFDPVGVRARGRQAGEWWQVGSSNGARRVGGHATAGRGHVRALFLRLHAGQTFWHRPNRRLEISGRVPLVREACLGNPVPVRVLGSWSRAGTGRIKHLAAKSALASGKLSALPSSPVLVPGRLSVGSASPVLAPGRLSVVAPLSILALGKLSARSRRPHPHRQR